MNECIHFCSVQNEAPQWCFILADADTEGLSSALLIFLKYIFPISKVGFVKFCGI